jgi:hypothetical protein
VREALTKARWREVDLASRPKGHYAKVKIALQLRRQTPMSRQWIADRLRIGVPALFQIYSPVSIVALTLLLLDSYSTPNSNSDPYSSVF